LRNTLYDPFYFAGRRRIQGVGSVSPAVTTLPGGNGASMSVVAPGPATIRSRRNSRLYVNNNRRRRQGGKDIDENLLKEDIYFFRRKPTDDTPSGLSTKDKLRILEESPYYYRQPAAATHRSRPHEESRRFPPPPDSFKFHTTTNVHHEPHPTQQRQYASAAPYEGRGYYPPHHTNQVDYYDRPNYRDRDYVQNRDLGREPLTRGTVVDGWSVQVGTQLQVHDDGRSRNPAQHYVRDERPGRVRGYPYHRDRQ
jgi:hypothetical protein